MSIRLLLAALFATPFLMPAAGAQPVQVGAFTQISLHGGGHVVIRHGATQSVNLLKGSLDYTAFTIKDRDTLDIETCTTSCHDYDLEVEIVLPDLKGVSIRGGGEIDTAGTFPDQQNLAVAVHGGGDLDVRGIAVKDVAADVHGGGDVKLTATRNLVAAVHGGGDIVFRGHPNLIESVHGGGSVDSED